jgi:GH25 family lysozyme M1 (1,4-beta-N-acetylmuramidase)
MTTTFADISHHQGSVDLAKYKAAGFDRIAIKATGGAFDGTLRFVDDAFAARWRQAGQLGLARVAYHFARSNNSGADEFDWFTSQVEAAGGLGARDVLCYDTEDNRSAQTVALAAARAREFTAAAVKAGHEYGWIYSGRWFLGPAGLTSAMLPPGWRNLWISDTTPQVIELPPGWTLEQVVACQFTDRGPFPGIRETDANFVIKEWIDMTSPSNWTPNDRRIVQDVIRGIVDERMSGWLAALAQGKLNSVGDDSRIVDLRRTLDTLSTKLSELSANPPH